jgi:hypothetical protein
MFAQIFLSAARLANQREIMPLTAG